MKKLSVFLILLAGCSSNPKRPVRTYECAVVGRHGVFAKIVVEASYLEEAQEEAEKVRVNLAARELIPAQTGVMCHVEGDSNE